MTLIGDVADLGAFLCSHICQLCRLEPTLIRTSLLINHECWHNFVCIVLNCNRKGEHQEDHGIRLSGLSLLVILVLIISSAFVPALVLISLRTKHKGHYANGRSTRCMYVSCIRPAPVVALPNMRMNTRATIESRPRGPGSQARASPKGVGKLHERAWQFKLTKVAKSRRNR